MHNRSLKIGLAALLAFVAFTTHAEPATPDAGTYRNPIGVDVADPDVLVHDGVYYLYGTSAADGFKGWKSRDLVNWEELGYVFQRSETSWGRDLFWAPCVIERDGAFYLFYNARGPITAERQSHRICVARAESPEGPFIDIAAPLFDIGKATIDAHAFIDEDGEAYLYYVRDVSESPQSQVFVTRLAPDFKSVRGQSVRCIAPSEEWEGDKWNEAPFVFRHNDTYVMTYSARGFFDPRYAVGYATARSPMGPWKKAANNPILKRTEHVSGPGHSSVAPSPDGSELFLVYHVHKSLKGGHERELAIDRLVVTTGEDGSLRLQTNGPTRDPMPLPSGVQVAPVASAPASAE